MFTLKRLWLDRDPQALKLWTELMVKAHLDPNEKVEYTVGIFPEISLRRQDLLTVISSNVLSSVKIFNLRIY